MTLSSIWHTNRQLAQQLFDLTPEERLAENSTEISSPADAIVAHIEVNDHHGVGVLVRRLFGQADNILSIRSNDFYAGEQDFGRKHIRISHGQAARDDVFWNVLEALHSENVKRVLCIPYFPDDALNAIAIKMIFGVPLCTYIMDDQNLCTEGIPDTVMAELLANSSLRLAISPALAAGYEQKYRHKMWVMPPVVPSSSIPAETIEVSDQALRSPSPIIVGNIWGQRWIELLRDTVRGSGVTLAWHNNGEFRWQPCSLEDLVEAGVIPQSEALADEDLIALLRATPFVVVPSGTLDDTDDRRFIAQLSLPSRIPYIFATSHAPILVMGNPETAAARFVVDAGIGMVAPYECAAFLRAVEQITSPEVNREMRRAAHRLASAFSDAGASDWIWSSLAAGEPVDRRYEDLMRTA